MPTRRRWPGCGFPYHPSSSPISIEPEFLQEPLDDLPPFVPSLDTAAPTKAAISESSSRSLVVEIDEPGESEFPQWQAVPAVSVFQHELRSLYAEGFPRGGKRQGDRREGRGIRKIQLWREGDFRDDGDLVLGQE